MNNNEQCPDSVSDRVIEDSERYHYAEHGQITVTGIWHQTRRLDTTRNVDDQDMIVVRYIPGEDGNGLDELAEPLDDFFDETD
ncbi:hypothetical protein [Haloterrigena salinisoli]|uniref:hypothetical protein n=1 Tax=Haloterrigena salinisoli TaxID=3132747 RepID=UPI0030CD0DC6